MKDFAAIAWDIDGTLVDSEPLHQNVLVDVCAGYGLDIKAMPPELFWGVHLDDVWSILVAHLPPGTPRERWMVEIIDRYVAGAPRLEPLPGARETMAAFAERGLSQVCVSNSGRRIVDANIAALRIEPWLSFSISFDDVEAGKPHPEPYRRACARLGLEPSRVVAVEDSPTGAASARAAGLFVVGLQPRDVVLPDVDIAVKSLEDLPALLPLGVK